MAEVKDKVITVESLKAVYDNIVTNIANPNILVNGDFQVWQRGTSFNNVGTFVYTADRWANCPANEQNLSVSRDDNGIRLATTDERVCIFQPIDKKLEGKDYTFSISVDGVVYDSVTFNVSGTDWHPFDLYYNGVRMGAFSIQHKANFDHTYLEIYIEKQSAVINWVKIEQGSKATPFVPKSYTEELMLCKRYYTKHNTVATIYYDYTDNSYATLVGFEWMRTLPTVVNTAGWALNNSAIGMASESYEVMERQENKILIRYRFPQSKANSACCFSANIELDAEIHS